MITDMFLKGVKPNVNAVCSELALSRRSLQEKLKAEKNCFRTLLESVCRQMAIDNLARKDIPICEVAFLLGYSDQSAFNHAFKRWTGKTPTAYCKTTF